MNRSFALRRDVGSVFAGSGAVAVRGIGEFWVDSKEVLTRASMFESQLRAFDLELEKNPKFALGGEPDAAKASEYMKLSTAEGNLWIDWFGNKDEVPPGSITGYRNELEQSALITIGSEELAEVKTFENRLQVLRDKYKSLGFEETIKPTPPVEPKDTLSEYERWLKIGGVIVLVGAAGYVLLLTQPLWMGALGMSAAAAR